MTLLVLHRNPLNDFPYDRWLADHPGGVVLLADRSRIELFGEQVPTGNGGYRHLEVLDDYDDSVLRRAVELARAHRVTRVLALHEGDLERAAVLRETLSLPGPRPADVLPFRDKVVMKQRLRAAGVDVAEHTVPADMARARAFAERHGLPLVFKARDGFGSRGLRIVRTAEELSAVLAREYGPGRAAREDLLLEAFVPGRMCHVDGLVVAGHPVFAWPSQYQYDLASFGSDPGPRIDLTLEPDDPLTDRLLDLTERALKALDPPADYAFHAEVFHTPDDRLVVCEIACRPGGARIREVMTAVFGVNPAEGAARAAVGLPIPVAGGRLAPRRMAGQVLMMKRPGNVRAVPEPPQESWVEFCGVFARPGQSIPPAAGSADFLAAAVVSAPTRQLCEQRLRALGTRLQEQIVIDAPESAPDTFAVATRSSGGCV